MTAQNTAESSLLQRLIQGIDRLTEGVGKLIAWLTLAMMFITCLVVGLRYGAGIGSIALQESVTYLHATVFLLGCAYTLQQGGHVRVDIFYRRFSTRQQAIVDLCGGLFFLLPLCAFILWSTWDYVLKSWEIREASPEASGLPLVYLLKTLMPVMAISLSIQTLAEVLKDALHIVVPPTSEEQTPNSGKGL